MKPESKRATAAAVAQSNSPSRLYHSALCSTSRINDVLAALVFGLEAVCLSPAEQATILAYIERLLRLKVDLGLLTGVAHGV